MGFYAYLLITSISPELVSSSIILLPLPTVPDILSFSFLVILTGKYMSISPNEHSASILKSEFLGKVTFISPKLESAFIL